MQEAITKHDPYKEKYKFLIVAEEKMLFNLRVPNAKTRNAMVEADEIVKAHNARFPKLRGYLIALKELWYNEPAAVTVDDPYEEKYEFLVESIKGLIKEAKEHKQDMKEHGLTFSGVEAEGYLRFALNVEVYIED